jgi:CRISPR-associated protein Cas2
MLVLVSYDIEDDKTRTRLAHKLLDFGPRVQFSVFEADVRPKELTKLKQMLGKVTLGEHDSIRLYNLCETCFGKITIWGKGEMTKDKEIYIA